MPRPSIRTHRFFLVLGVCVLLTLACKTGHVVTSGWRARKLPWSPDEASDCCAKYYAPALSQDSRGWLLDPISAASRAGISGAAMTCKAVHVGQIKSGFIRGNHRHHFCNETFIVWGAKAKFRVENPSVTKGYTEIVISMDEVGVLGGPAGRAHALVNMDNANTLHFLGCQDASADPSNTDYNVWTNLKAA